MDILAYIKNTAKERQEKSRNIDHFSIEGVGRKFYVFTHDTSEEMPREKIGSFMSYKEAKDTINIILDLKVESNVT